MISCPHLGLTTASCRRRAGAERSRRLAEWQVGLGCSGCAGGTGTPHSGPEPGRRAWGSRGFLQPVRTSPTPPNKGRGPSDRPKEGIAAGAQASRLVPTQLPHPCWPSPHPVAAQPSRVCGGQPGLVGAVRCRWRPWSSSPTCWASSCCLSWSWPCACAAGSCLVSGGHPVMPLQGSPALLGPSRHPNPPFFCPALPPSPPVPPLPVSLTSLPQALMTQRPLTGELPVGPLWPPPCPVWPWGWEWGPLLPLTKPCLSCQLDPK